MDKSNSDNCRRIEQKRTEQEENRARREQSKKRTEQEENRARREQSKKRTEQEEDKTNGSKVMQSKESK